MTGVGLTSVGDPGQQCYRKSRRRHEHIKFMIVRTCIAYASIQNVKEYSCCTNSNNTPHLSYCLQIRHVSTFASSKVNDEI